VHRRIRIQQPAQIGTEQIVALRFGQEVDERLPVLRIDQADRTEPPVEIDLAAQPDPAQHERTTCFGMSRRVSQRERRAPRSAEHQPAIDAEMATQSLDVAHDMLRGVLVHAGDRRGTAGAALIEQHDPVRRGIEEAPMRRIAAGTGAAVQEHRRSTGRIAAQLVHEAMAT